MFVSEWCGRAGRTWTYFLPEDCRPTTRRVAVHMWEDRVGSKVTVIEGDGRKRDFHRLAEIVLPDHATDEDAAAVASELASRHLASPDDAESADERLVAGVLTARGFTVDDFWSQEAWLMPAEQEDFVWYVRGAPEPHFFTGQCGETHVLMAGPLQPEMPCEVGLASEMDRGRSYVVVPSIEEAIRVVDEELLPIPDEDEVQVFEFDRLFSSMAAPR